MEKFCWFTLGRDPSPFCLDNYEFWLEGDDLYQDTKDPLDPEQITKYKKDEWFPIPSISDCLDKLRELKVDIYDMRPEYAVGGWSFNGNLEVEGDEYGKTIFFEKDTLHLALLSALLEVVKSGGK